MGNGVLSEREIEMSERVIVAYSAKDKCIWLEKGNGFFPAKIEFDDLEQAHTTAQNILAGVEILRADDEELKNE